MHRRPGSWAEQVAVPVGPRLIPPIGCDDQKWGESILQLLTDLSYGLTVATTTVIHNLALFPLWPSLFILFGVCLLLSYV